MKYIVEDKVSEMSCLANDIMAKLYQEDPRGKLLYLFITKLIAISKLTAYGIDDENKLYVVTKDEYERLKGKVMKLKTEVNVERLINRFEEMANRDALLVGEDISQEDLLVQIIGVIATEAMK